MSPSTGGSAPTRRIGLTVNGPPRETEVEPRTLLVHFLREQLGLTGTHIGGDTSSCGACTVHLDGCPVKSCTVFAVQADSRSIRTVEGWSMGASSRRCRWPSPKPTGFSAGFARRGW